MLAALGANIGIAIIKLVAFVLTGSASLLAEFVHSLADCSDQVLLLVGRSRADRAETEEHPFGYGRERYFWAFVVALVQGKDEQLTGPHWVALRVGLSR